MAEPPLTAVVYRAAAMVSLQLEVSLDDALDVLRARAFVTDRPLAELARDVVARRYRFEGGLLSD